MRKDPACQPCYMLHQSPKLPHNNPDPVIGVPLCSLLLWDYELALHNNETAELTHVNHERGASTLVGPKGKALNQRKLLLSLKIHWYLPFYINLLGTHHYFLFSNFFLLERECLSYTCPTTVFWKHVIYLIS